jgi:hypothetical protein
MLIGLCGYPQAGKSEVRDILVREHGFLHVDTKMALRHLAGYVASVEPGVLNTQEGKEALYYGVTGRKIMGEIGNCVEGLFGDDFMLRKTLKVYRDVYGDVPMVVDALRKNQTKAFTGLVYQVVSNRAAEPQGDYDRFYQGNTHGIIINDGSLEDLSASVKRVFDL